MKLIKLGVWIWGGTTVLLAAFFLVVVVASGFFIEPRGEAYHIVGAPNWLYGLFYSLKENGSLVAGILGFSGLAWAHFFKADNNVQ